MTGQPFHLHVENLRSQSPVFHITANRYAIAAGECGIAEGEIRVTYGWDGDILEREMAGANSLMGWRFPRTNLKERAPALQWIHVTGAGIEHLLPLDWIPPGVVLTNNSGVHAEKAGEYVAMAMLALNTRIPFFASAKEKRSWSRRFASCIRGKTAVIVGTGNMGSAGARRCSGLGMHVIGVNSSGQRPEYFDEVYAVEALHDALPLADFLLVALPLTDRTRHLIGREELDLLPAHCGVVNIGRAGVMHYEALFEKLRRQEIGGAILDVFEPEPVPEDSSVWNVPNLIITPHVSSDDVERYAIDTVKLFFENYRYLKEHHDLKNRVDPVLQY